MRRTIPNHDSRVPEFRPKGEQVLIRMYGQGVGDCFLLAFPRTRLTDGAVDEEEPVYVLIDCGVVMGTPDGPDRMEQIVADIKDTTGGHLDLLVVTHEHWDHLSGFLKAKETWNQIKVDKLWMAWTEKNDPNGLPGVLKRIQQKQRVALAQVADHALRFGMADRQRMAIGMMSFLSDDPVDGRSFSATAGVGDAFDSAKALVPADHHVCCEPGEVRFLPGTDALCYVLGPPRSDARLRQTDPSKDKETYESADTGAGGQALAVTDAERQRRQALQLAELNTFYSLQRMAESRSAFNSFTMPLLGPMLLGANGEAPKSGDANPTGVNPAAEWDLYERSFPFDRTVRVPPEAVEVAVADHPGGYPIFESYRNEVSHWRRIDFDWLDAAETFALQADNLTNNTSLVLAIELPPKRSSNERNVLLFVGDAQVGNWLSWDEIPAWLPQDGATPNQPKPDIGDLLKRTVFYKVGHHGSHNATLKKLGIERMRDDKNLTAFVPVSHSVADKVKGWSEMPLIEMLGPLSQRADGKVAFPDGNVWPNLDENQLDQERARIGVAISDQTLPPKIRLNKQTGEDEKLEGAVPLWIQVGIDY